MEDFCPEKVTALWAAPFLVLMLSVSPPSQPGSAALVGAGAVHLIRTHAVLSPSGQPAAEDAAERDHHARRSPRGPAGVRPRLQSRLQPGWAGVHLLQGRKAGHRQGGLRCSAQGPCQHPPPSGAAGAGVAVSCIPHCPHVWESAFDLGRSHVGNCPCSETAQVVPAPGSALWLCLIDHNKRNHRSSADLFRSFR